MSEIQTISVVVAAISVVAFVVNSIITSRREEKRSQDTLETRQAQLFMSLYQHVYSPEMAEANSIFYEKLKDYEDYVSMIKDPKRAKPFNTWGMWLEGQGVLVREDFISIKMISELVGGLIIIWWNIFGPYILRYRREGGNPRHMIESEYLYKRVVEYCMGHPELGIATPDLHISQ